MIPVEVMKIIPPLITGVIALLAGFVELRLNPKNWLNRWFFSFFLSASLAHFAYTIYHLVIISETITSIGAVITQIFFNLIPISLVMTVFVLEKFSKVAMSLRYLGVMMLIFILMSLGSILLPPKPDPTKFANGIIDTNTNPIWFISVNFLRMALFGYALFKYGMIIKKTEGEAKQRMKWFFIGILISFIGLIMNLLGGILINTVIEVLALILFNIGTITIVKGFFI